MSKQTTTPTLYGPDQSKLREAFVGTSLDALRTPCFVVDRSVVARNCAKMHERAQKTKMGFRAHVKTLKSAEVMRHQLKSSAGTSNAIVCSTMPEILGAMASGCVEDGLLEDILYGLPLPIDRLTELAGIADKLARHDGTLRVLLDNPAQVQAVDAWVQQEGKGRRWSAFIKCDAGGNRAGLPPLSDEMRELITTTLASNAIDIFGFYCHNGASYASKSIGEAAGYLTGELAAVNDAAGVCIELMGGKPPSVPFVLAMGSTPAAHAVAEQEALVPSTLNGVMELHAGCYPACDLQQMSTKAIGQDDVAIKVLSRVISTYTTRKEAMCDVGGLGMSRDSGPSGGFGAVVEGPAKGWKLDRTSQEHGLLKYAGTDPRAPTLSLGQVLPLIPQHACLTAAQFPWYYVIEDGGDKVVDVWVPWKFW